MELAKLQTIEAGPPDMFGREQVELIKRTIAQGATDDELQMFLSQARRTGLDPFARQIYAIKRWDGKQKREVMATQVSIDGLRLIAERSRKYAGQTPPEWCGPDGAWRDVWLESKPPSAARIGILRHDFTQPVYAVARYESYVQRLSQEKGGGPNSMWAKLPDVMLSKCAESLALRKAFPLELSGLYTGEETGAIETAEDTAATPKAKRTTPFDILTEFGKMKKRYTKLGKEDVYYTILPKYGVEKSDQFPATEQGKNSARSCWRELRDTIQELEAATSVAEAPAEIKLAPPKKIEVVADWADLSSQPDWVEVGGITYHYNTEAGNYEPWIPSK